MARTTISTPNGEVSWEGELKDSTRIRFADGNEAPFSRLFSLTNGECFDWFRKYLSDDDEKALVGLTFNQVEPPLRFSNEPEISHKAARAVQLMPFELRIEFIKALEDAKQESDLSALFLGYLNNGYLPDNPTPPQARLALWNQMIDMTKGINIPPGDLSSLGPIIYTAAMEKTREMLPLNGGKLIRYFGLTTIDGSIYGIYRYVFENDGLIEEVFNQNKMQWDETSHLTKMFLGGECTLGEITEEDAKKAFPLAFIDSQPVAPTKVEPTLEEALKNIIIERMN